MGRHLLLALVALGAGCVDLSRPTVATITYDGSDPEPTEDGGYPEDEPSDAGCRPTMRARCDGTSRPGRSRGVTPMPIGWTGWNGRPIPGRPT